MRVTVTIQCDTAAFEDGPGYEVSRILSKLASDIAAYQRLNGELDDHRTLRDANGNTVGCFEVMD